MRKKGLFYLLIALTVLAMGFHWHLATQHNSLEQGILVSDTFCTGSETFDCNAVNSSDYSELFDVSIALWGFSTHAILLLMLLIGGNIKNKRDLFKQMANVLQVFIGIMSIVMFIIAKGLLGKLCLYCTVLYGISFIQLGVSMYRLKSLKIKWIPRIQMVNLSQFFMTLAVLMLIPTITMAIQLGHFKAPEPQGVHAESPGGDHTGHNHNQKPVSEEEIVGMWFANPKIDFKDNNALVNGSTGPSAKMTIYEFADFRCGHCGKAAESISEFVKDKTDVRWVFMPYPLDGACNENIKNANGHSCKLAKAALCANKQPSGWAFHKYLFENQSKFFKPETLESTLVMGYSKFNLNVAEMEACIKSDEVQATITSFTQQGKAAGVRGTPAIYVNGKYLPAGQRPDILERVYKGL